MRMNTIEEIEQDTDEEFKYQSDDERNDMKQSS